MTGSPGNTVQWLGAGTPLAPWTETPAQLLAECSGDAALYAPPASPGRRVIAAPHVAWSAETLRRMEVAVPAGSGARLEVTCNAMTEHVAALGGAPLTQDGRARAFDLALTPEGDAPRTREALRALPPVRLDLPCDTESVRTDGMGPAPQRVVLPRTAAWVAHIHAWPQLLWTLQGLPSMWALSAPRRDARGNVLAPGVRIHQAALVENSVLMEGVEVEAHATIMNSFLGRGVRVADHAAVHHCVMAEGVQTLADGFFRRVVALPHSTLSNVDLRESILGRHIFITAGVIFFTGSPGVNAPYGQSPGTLQDSGHAELGCAVGHRCVLGTRAIVEPGRALPGGTVIVMRPEEGVMHTPTDLPPGTAVAWDDAGLAPVEKRWPGYVPPELE